MRNASRLTAFLGLAVAGIILPDLAWAQGAHHSVGVSLSGEELLAGIARGALQGAAVFLVGLVAFVALVWHPASRHAGSTIQDPYRLFVRALWVLFGLLLLAGLLDLSVYAVRASKDAFGPQLLWQALHDTQAGQLWLIRLGFGLFTVLVASWAAEEGSSAYRWGALAIGSGLLITLSQRSHAAAADGPLPILLDWLHVVAAAVWMGGLLGFPMLLFGPLRSMSPEVKAKLLALTVRRFSRTAAFAVITIVATGLYGSLLHISDFSALIGTPYGRALIMKLGLLALMLPIGAINMFDRGRDPFGRMVGAELVLAFAVFLATGFLTSLPPAGDGLP